MISRKKRAFILTTALNALAVAFVLTNKRVESIFFKKDMKKRRKKKKKTSARFSSVLITIGGKQAFGLDI